VKQIKRFSYSKKTAEIKEYVERHFEIRNDFALGTPYLCLGWSAMASPLSPGSKSLHI
jgi:hypothetical protein